MNRLNDTEANQRITAEFLDSGAQPLSGYALSFFAVYEGPDFPGSMTNLVRLVSMVGDPLTVATIGVITSRDKESKGVDLWRLDDDALNPVTNEFFRLWFEAQAQDYNILIPVARLDNPLHHTAAKALQDAGSVLNRAVPSPAGWTLTPVADSHDPVLFEVPEGSFPGILLHISNTRA
ncbi:hypothetical protein Q6670_004113 [Salmonella enterica]|nr:hypothetical protein [Salmonella enterica]